MNTIRTISDVPRDKADETKKGITFVESRRDVLVPYGRVHAEAVAAATRLAEAGIGPFEVHADSLARACIDSGTGYIDVNDSIDARRAIMALDGDARREGVPVLTGFGLCPGLSTALLMLGACAAGAEEVRDVRVDLRIGADQESGAASVESMFRTIRGGYRAMLGGAIVEVRRNLVSSQSGIGYECPDIDVVRGVCPSILGFSYHVAFDALPDESVEKIRTSRLYAMPVVSGLLARLGAAEGAGERHSATRRAGHRTVLRRRGRCGVGGRDNRRPGDWPGFLQNDRGHCRRHRCVGRGEAGRAGVPGSRQPPPAPRTGPRLRPRCRHPYRNAA